jgi:phosphoribosylanthranilate isomerase
MTAPGHSSPAGGVGPLEVKICGVTSADELHLLDEAGVDYAGLWFQIPAGRHCLDPERSCALARRPLRRLRCVGVTTESDPDVIVRWAQRSGVVAVQLHGFQMPAIVKRIKRSLQGRAQVWKVLHAQAGVCLEKALLRAYAACGADAFILDSFVSRQQPGSTGKRVPLSAVTEVLEAVGGENLFLAGGMEEDSIRMMCSRLRLRGVDVDTAARNPFRLDLGRVSGLVRAARCGGA